MTPRVNATVADESTAGARGMIGVVLAAGRGSRMGVLTESLPKPLLPVLDKPAIEWVIDGFIKAGLGRAVVVTGYLGEMVVEALSGYRADKIKIDFVQQDVRSGTARALDLTREAVGGGDVMLAFADIMTSAENFARMAEGFYRDDCDLTASVRDVGDPWRAAAVYVNARWDILRIVEKPPPGTSITRWSHAGMYCFKNSVYEYLDRIEESPRGEFEVTDAVQMMIADKRRCKAVELTGYWRDLATPEDLSIAERLMQDAGE